VTVSVSADHRAVDGRGAGSFLTAIERALQAPGDVMTRDEIRDAVVQALTSVAPEIDPETSRPDMSFRQEFDLDSMDFLNFVIAVHGRLGVDVPESDYVKLATLNGAVDYLAARLQVLIRSPPAARSKLGNAGAVESCA
jgi:acyl carrier protein